MSDITLKRLKIAVHVLSIIIDGLDSFLQSVEDDEALKGGT